ncbi:hypothetical protein NEOLEDRAFT_1155737 [Neolentinus lepideus HHB14362 ss-1]|uniref:FHF complex subunit HOOK-interacting protein C-terminal domain-containing protein n=1 Tax=Neolentinus lepideus HHB14362 ss-1 TaxID=1314782 RepID=A0A165T6H8_9AGAM|nr:hypothetical protein NEOLEDRAFT_1155737 [Neolentinus lepideus HHB14362 ss-1]
MDYFSKFLRSTGIPAAPKPPHDHALEFHKSWSLVKNTLLYPDERQLTRGIKATDVPVHLQSMVDSLVWESTRTEEGATGACLEYLLKNDVLGTLVKLSESDRPFGIQAEVLRAVQNMVVLLDEQFLVHSAVHKAVLRLLRNCAGEDLQEQLDNRNRVMGAAKNAARSSPSEYEEDLVNLLCILCSRIRTYRELLMIFFHDKHWYRPEPLFSVEEEDEEEEDEKDDETLGDSAETSKAQLPPSPSPSQGTITSAPESSATKKPEYEFLLFNYLLRFVHREGQIGDFARAGLLFLMDVAMSPGEPVHRLGGDEAKTPTTSSESQPDPIADAALALAEYIVDGDFSEVLGAGLSAVYSVLPRKLEIRPPPPSDGALGNSMLIGSTGPLSEEEREKDEVERDNKRAMGVEDSSDPDFKAHLDHFLKLLEFLQDVIRRNVVHESDDSNLDASSLVGTAIVQSILDAVQKTFLENVLYPSILECSDADGSAVAVMAYIETMIRDLGEGEISNLLVNFLTSEDNDEEPRSRKRHQSMLNLDDLRSKKTARMTSKAERRKSSAMMLLEMEAPDTKKQSEYFTSMGRFTLKDLILSNLRSKSQPTGTAALQLLRSMLLQHCHLSVERLFIVFLDSKATSFPIPALLPLPIERKSLSGLTDIEEDDDDETFLYPGAEDPSPPSFKYSAAFPQPETTYSTHEREMGLYLTLVSRVDPSHDGDAFSTGYDHYLRDALLAIQSHGCFSMDVDAETRAKLKHRLNPNDPILSLILESLQKFFANSPEYNMALTGVLATLAICPDRSLAGWLTFMSNEGERIPPADMEAGVMWTKDDGDDRSIDFRIEERLESESHPLPASILDENSRPVVHTIFHGLVSQLERYRLLVDDFDKYLTERRQGLLFNENLTDALTLALDMDNNITSSSSRVSLNAPETPSKPKSKPSKSASLVSFLTPRKNKAKAATMEPATPPRKTDRLVPPSPFASHYQETSSVNVEPFAAAPPSFGPWQPGQARRWSTSDDDVFTGSNAWGDKDENPFLDREPKDKGAETPRTTTITLSQLLDNVVILEESIKELAAIIHARRSLGIDAVRYL